MENPNSHIFYSVLLSSLSLSLSTVSVPLNLISL